MKHLSKRPSGFTMLEVMIALAILAVAFTALATLQAKNLSLTSEDQRMTLSTLLARDILTRLRSGILPLQDSEGGFDDDYPEWRWKIRVSDHMPHPFISVEITISPAGGSKDEASSFWVLLRRGEPP